MQISGVHSKSLSFKLTVLILSIFIWSSVQADLILTSPPRESESEGIKQYGPLAERLSQVLGVKVTYHHPKSWMYYQRDMRADKYDIVFDDPHLMSWRMKKIEHTLVARLPGEVGFVLIVEDEDSAQKLMDLVNKNVCALPPPNLATLTVLDQFGTVRLPRLKSVKGGMDAVFAEFKQGKCRAAILSDSFYLKTLSKEKRAGTRMIYRSLPMQNQGVTVSKRVTREMQVLITADLTQVSSVAAPMLKRFALNSNMMLAANPQDYEQYYRILSDTIYGW